QFRPQPPIPLSGEEWARDYNEIKNLGAKASTARSARQSEDARFWLVAGPASYYQLVRHLVVTKKMSLVDSARFRARTSVPTADAFIAVVDAKYHYGFLPPVTG